MNLKLTGPRTRPLPKFRVCRVRRLELRQPPQCALALSPKGKTADTGDNGEPLVSERRRKRPFMYVPTMALWFLFVGWFFAGVGLGWFFLAGLGMGVFIAWSQSGEHLLGTLAAISGLFSCMLAVSRPLLFVTISTGTIVYVAGIDDRLRNGWRWLYKAPQRVTMDEAIGPQAWSVHVEEATSNERSS